MAITSLFFFIFIFAVLIVYYLVPKKIQWVILLAASIGFYISFGARSLIYVLITAGTVYAGTRIMEYLGQRRSAVLKEKKEILSKEEKSALKKRYQRGRRAVMLAVLLINIGILCVFKYYHFAFAQINALITSLGGQAMEDTLTLIVPLGISFYTFQAVGYLADVYWEYYRPEKNIFKVLLFVSFFPQMTQGPISDFEQLSKELFASHKLEYKNYAWGFQRMLWGFVKKLIIADTLSVYVQSVFANYSQYTGLTTLIGALMYSVQIYADFSGYMDIMCGYCEMLGIRLAENFERPYFSKSVTEYWRRWHITLGAWFKKYIYYPIGMSSWARRLGRFLSSHFGKSVGTNLPATLALIIVWCATGLWHGASWSYIAWGGINGIFIILSIWLEPVYTKMRKGLRIRESAVWWRAFQVLRTFALVTIIKVLPEVGDLKDGLSLWGHVFSNHEIPADFSQLLPFVGRYWLDVVYLLLAVAGTIVMFWFSMMQRKCSVRERFNRKPYVLRIIVLAAVLLLCISFGVYGTYLHGNGGFLYAQF